ncbi:MAG: hypothetical protein KDN19_21585 [Verrucomicrobiae bacterium]|nr:hypothetical protein [Verrucomicrobiae bacterium]
MQNPYEKFDAHRSEVRVGHGLAWVLTFVFLLLCLLPPFWRNANEFLKGGSGWTPVIELFRYSPKDGTLGAHLRAAEKKIEDAEYTVAPRQWMQGVLTSTLREGNRKTAIGKDGWLYFGPAIDALTGYGPLKPEPDTVAKDPNREPWNGPFDAIVKFNEQLESLGVELILMPIPVKPMILPEHLIGKPAEGPISHPDAEKFYATLREKGIEVFDVSDDWFAAAREGDQVFLKQDTHWTPEMMQATAKRVAAYLKQQAWFDDAWMKADRFELAESQSISAPGDLLEKLELPAAFNPFSEETAKVTVVKEGASPATIYDTDSPIVLLGDSFTNIYHAREMKWGESAGFAEHLSQELGMTLDTIAQNGQASTGVRRTLAVRPNAAQSMRDKKKVVIWAIAARDLFLSETVARENQVRWDDVEFQTGDPSKDIAWPVEIEGTVTMVSSFLDPKTAPYPASVYAVEYQVDRVVSGKYLADSALVFHWAFRDRKRSDTGDFKVGERHRLTLVPMDQQESLRGINQSNDSMRFELIPAWAESVKVMSENGPGTPSVSEEAAARGASMATGAFCLIFGGVILLIYRKKRNLRASVA